jgi:hypothetical protein
VGFSVGLALEQRQWLLVDGSGRDRHTGKQPGTDLSAQAYSKPFVSLFRERNIPEIESMYEVSFPKLSDRYFKQGPWPPVDAISDLVDQDHVFCLLYKVRHQQHARVGWAECKSIAAVHGSSSSSSGKCH